MECLPPDFVKLLGYFAGCVGSTPNAAWKPDATFIFCGDGAYACLAGQGVPNVLVVSRIRRDAAIYAPGPVKRKKHQRGPAPRKGKRIRTPQQCANALPNKAWRLHCLCLYGHFVERQIYIFTAVWDSVRPGQSVTIVCVRDPNGEHDDEFFFSTDLTMSPEEIILYYTGRWSIEVVFRECKQYLGIQDPQARKMDAILRIVPFGLWLTALRTHFWRNLISPRSTSAMKFGLILDFIVKSLAKVAQTCESPDGTRRSVAETGGAAPKGRPPSGPFP